MSELSIIEATNKMLSLHGESEIVYLTAEFSPFLNQHKPDLLFHTSDSIKKQIFFIEYKENLNQNYINELNRDLIEHQDFIQESILERFTYIFATNTNLNPGIIEELRQNKIIAISPVEDETDIYNTILKLIK